MGEGKATCVQRAQLRAETGIVLGEHQHPGGGRDAAGTPWVLETWLGAGCACSTAAPCPPWGASSQATEQQALPINLGRASCCNEDGEVYPRFPRRISEIANRFSRARRWAFPTPPALAACTTSAAPGLRAPEEEPGRSIRLSWYATSPAGSVIRAITAVHRRAVHHSPFVPAAGHQQDASRGTALPRGLGTDPVPELATTLGSLCACDALRGVGWECSSWLISAGLSPGLAPPSLCPCVLLLLVAGHPAHVEARRGSQPGVQELGEGWAAGGRV